MMTGEAGSYQLYVYGIVWSAAQIPKSVSRHIHPTSLLQHKTGIPPKL